MVLLDVNSLLSLIILPLLWKMVTYVECKYALGYPYDYGPEYNSGNSKADQLNKQDYGYNPGSYRHYETHCVDCFTADPTDSCAQGSPIDGNIVKASKCKATDINMCYTFITTELTYKSEVTHRIRRGCAQNNANPCNAGVHYDSCSYKLCPHDLCNSFKKLSGASFFSLFSLNLFPIFATQLPRL
ncbi:uncharacterized protein LOC142351798 isoform X2 [Convolutriloba macropyga]|uniref:uncharacterized protein LOC142351798 isoform X2 n=1 Tax=Convolutriloba macropyga TaxID=536237 RepID=UPI003F51C3F8